ncbi:putative general secretion pathway domain protein [Mycobacterium xenopi 4042]|uniref:Putative general secretion pathway domain protein n=1 Tax=Mycobacterium xenopi 4042 TaxID=1299334 RepID=X8BEL3_MYCXE|nr:putative general secretion pathway domain protein [Mycobacterium xenopi 4042]
MLHRHSAHNEAVARIGWCVAERRIGVITGEVGAARPSPCALRWPPSTAAVTPSSICLTPPSGARHPPPHRRLTRRQP